MSSEPSEKTISKFLGCHSSEIIPGRPALLGCPLDLTSTYRSGSGAAPDYIRAVSESIETYSPLLDMDLEDTPFSDIGDLPLQGQSLESCINRIRSAVSDLVEQRCVPLCLGGEHTVTLPVVEALEDARPGFVLLHLDAHSDLRDVYEGSRVNHATVIRRICDTVGPSRLIQLGVRGGTREEFDWMRGNGTLIHWESGAEKTLLTRVAGRPVYVTVDLDVLDPSYMPATGNPEAGGWSYKDLERFLMLLDALEIVGADVVELNPGLDPCLVGSITAAKIVRELLLIMGK